MRITPLLHSSKLNPESKAMKRTAQVPDWVLPLIRAEFHTTRSAENESSPDRAFFCLECRGNSLSAKEKENHERRQHKVLRVHKSSFQYGVDTTELQKILNVEEIDTNKINKITIYYIQRRRNMKKPDDHCRKKMKLDQDGRGCHECGWKIKDYNARYCSVECKFKHQFEAVNPKWQNSPSPSSVLQQDSPSSSNGDRGNKDSPSNSRMGNKESRESASTSRNGNVDNKDSPSTSRTKMADVVQEEASPPRIWEFAQVKGSPPVVIRKRKIIYRKRQRKQAKPRRAPFF